MKIVCISDIHSQLPQIPACDVLAISGDFVNSMDLLMEENRFWLDNDFRFWLESIPARHIVSTPGNHDFIFQSGNQPKDLEWHYLQDSGIEIEGVKFWGTPWQPVFGNWAFNADDHLQEKMFQKIASDTQILLSHSPPFGYGDFVGGQRVGSNALLKRCLELNKLELVVCGHIHNAYGRYSIDRHGKPSIKVYNSALVNRNYQIVNKPFVYTRD